MHFQIRTLHQPLRLLLMISLFLISSLCVSKRFVGTKKEKRPERRARANLHPSAHLPCPSYGPTGRDGP